MQSHGQGEGLFGDGCLDNYKRGHVWFFIAEHSEERSYWMHYLCAPCWGYSKSMQLTTQDKPKEIEMQLEYIILLMGQPEEGSHVWCFKSIVQYLYSAVTIYSILSWNTMHLWSLVTETRTYIPCSEGPRCTRSPGEAYPYHAVSEERNQHVLQTSKPHSRD